MRDLFITNEYGSGGLTESWTTYENNPDIDSVVFCECGGYGTSSQYGRDYVCRRCKKPLDWSKEEKW